MKRLWEVGAFVVLCGVMLWATGMWAPLKQEGRRAVERVVWGDPAGRVTDDYAVSFQPGEGGTVTVTGGGMTATRQEGDVATKTNTYDGQGTVSGILAVRNQDTSPMLISAATKQTRVDVVGGGGASITDISTEWHNYLDWDPPPEPPPNTALVFMVMMSAPTTVFPPVGRHAFVYFEYDTPAPWDIELQYQVSVTGQRLERAESLSYGPGRSGRPVYAKERTVSEQFQGIRPASWNVAVTSDHGSFSSSGTQTWDEGMGDWWPPVDPVTRCDVMINMHKGADATKYAEATVNWANWPVSFDGGSKVFGSIYKMIGNGNALECWVPGTGGVSNGQHTVGVGRPLILDLGLLYTRDRVGATAPYDNLRIDGPFQATPRYPASLNWSTEP